MSRNRVAFLRGCGISLVTAGLLAASAPPAQSHPHVWIQSRSSVVFDDQGRVAAIKVAWEFDEYYSTVAISGLDTDGDGMYTPDELLPVARDNIEALGDFRYFTFAKVDGEAVPYGPVSEYRATHAESMVTLEFTIPLAKPVDPLTRTLTYRMYDPTFYISIDYAPKTPIVISGKAPKYCKAELGKSAAEVADANASESFFAQLDAVDDYGARFAQPVNVTCARKTTSQ